MIRAKIEDTSGIAPRLLEGGPVRAMFWTWMLVQALSVLQAASVLVLFFAAIKLQQLFNGDLFYLVSNGGWVWGLTTINGRSTPLEGIGYFADANHFALYLLSATFLVVAAAGWFVCMGFRPKSTGLTTEGAWRSLLLLSPAIAILVVAFWRIPQVSLMDAMRSDLLGPAIALGVSTALVHELIGRGLVMGMLGGRDRPLLAVAGSTMFMALTIFLVVGITTGAVYLAWASSLIFGIPFGVAYLRTGSMVGLLAFHAGWNVLMLASFGRGELVSGSGSLAAWLLPLLLSGGYLAWYLATDDVTVPRLRRLLQPRRKASVDWDALADDDIVNPWISAQVRAASGE